MVIRDALACSCERLVKSRFSSSPSSWLKSDFNGYWIVFCPDCYANCQFKNHCSKTMVEHITQVYNFFRSQFFSCSVYYFTKLLKKVIFVSRVVYLCWSSNYVRVPNTPFWMRQGIPFFLSKENKFERWKLESISTFCQTLAAPFQSRIHSSTWDGYVGGHLLQGPPHLSSISLAKQVGPLLLGAQGSSPRNGLGPLQCNMSDKWNILRPFWLFFGHEHGRSLLLVRTACGTVRKKIKTQTNWKRIRVDSMTFKIGIALEKV